MGAVRTSLPVPRVVEDYRQSGYTDTQTLQAALDAGGWLWLDRNYTITSRLSGTTAKTRLSGTGTITQSTAAQGGFLWSADDCVIEGVTLVGSSTTGNSDVYGVSFTGDRGTVRGCNISGFTVGATLAGDYCKAINNHVGSAIGTGSGQGYGVLVLAPDCVVSGNTMQTIGRHGVYLSGNASYGGALRATVSGNVITLDGSLSDGIKVYATSAQTAITLATITGNTVRHINPQSGATQGISVYENVTDCTITGNTILGTNSAALKVAATGASLPYRIVFSGNACNHSGGGYFIKLEESGSYRPTDCVFRGNTSDVDSFTAIYDGGTNSTFIGNYPYARSEPVQAIWTSPAPAAAATPSVYKGNVFTVANGGATTVTNLLHGKQGQKVTLIFSDENTTLQHGSNLKLAGGSDFVSSANDVVGLVYTGSVWVETERSVNG